MAEQRSRRISFDDISAEPFRIFFPAAVIAGLVGVALWPLHFAGIVPFYPGTSHARLLGHGFFGGFIFGVLGTALPRLLSAKHLTLSEVGIVFSFYLGMIGAHGLGKTVLGDWLLLGLVAAFAISVFRRATQRKDMPPPGFVLVALAFGCVIVGIILSSPELPEDASAFRIALPRLLLYQGFILLPVLGVGGFLLPRFFGLESSQEFPESAVPPPGWAGKALTAALVGVVIIGSFVVEAAGWHRLGHWIRLLVSAAYLLHVIPFYRAEAQRNSLATALKTAFVLVLSGFLFVAVFPAYRVALLHLTLVGGFAIITLSAATRVVFGNSGNRALLAHRNRWVTVAMILMLLGMATRISGDFWPKIMVSHYNYGALFWAVGVLVWARYVLPKVLVPDSDE